MSERREKRTQPWGHDHSRKKRPAAGSADDRRIVSSTGRVGGFAHHVPALERTSRRKSMTCFSRSITPLTHIALRAMSFTIADQLLFLPLKDSSSCSKFS